MPDSDPPQHEQDRPPRKRRLGIPGLRGAILGVGDPAPAATPKRSTINEKQLTGKLAGLSLPRQVFVLALWPLLEQVLNFLVGTVDFAIAGRLPGDNTAVDAIDAIAVASYFVWLMTILQAAAGVGAAAIVSRAIGASHRRLANAGTGQAVLLGIGSGLFAGTAIFIAAPWIAAGFGLEGSAQQMASDYIRITAVGIPMCGVLFTGGAVLRAAGDTRSPFLAMLLVNVINIALSVGLGGLRYGDGQTLGLGLGVTGIAWGTAIAWTVGGLAVLIILLSGRSELRLRPHRLKPHRHTMRRIINVALPNLYYQLAFWVINFVLLLYISRLMIEGAYGAHSIAMRIHSISFLPGYAISIAASTLTGQYLGLGDPSRAKRATYLALGGTLCLMVVCSALFFFFPSNLVALLSPDTAVHLELAPPLLQLSAFVTPLLAMNLILNGAMQGAGDTRNTAIINLTGLTIFRLGGAYVYAFPLGMGLWGIWLGIMTDIGIRGIVFWFYYHTNRWAKTTV
ncbi:MAG: MATE family efflux transporter [Phycisphaeraceae bacterium]|nr:MATE family efflux transporter [Phycisphaeraceae bacterium]